MPRTVYTEELRPHIISQVIALQDLIQSTMQQCLLIADQCDTSRSERRVRNRLIAAHAFLTHVHDKFEFLE
jgi:hypothetical protein